ncbi:MAG: hypothetical protein ACI4ED_05195 [Suilimivivens sp.]
MKKKKFVMIMMLAVSLSTVSMTAYAAPRTMPDGTVFDAEYYAETYPDVKAAFGNDETALYNHYMQYGRSEGRKPYKEAAVSPVANATLVSSYTTWSSGGDYAIDTYSNGIKVVRSLEGSVAVDKKYWILRTDFSDGLLDEDGNGIDDRDPCNNNGYTDLNYNGVIDGAPSLPHYVPESEITKYWMCEHGVIQGLYICNEKECLDDLERMRNARLCV